MKQTKLLSSADAKPGLAQHTKPCTDCPMARSSLPTWLGGATPHEYMSLAHSDALVECHVHTGVHCAGMAIYRRNACKRVEFPGLRLAADHERVFSTPAEFIQHHKEFK